MAGQHVHGRDGRLHDGEHDAAAGVTAPDPGDHKAPGDGDCATRGVGAQPAASSGTCFCCDEEQSWFRNSEGKL
jgi:hypothetical protein